MACRGVTTALFRLLGINGSKRAHLFDFHF
jgi:hypothetical protein